METKDTCLYIHTRKSDGGIFYVGIGNEKRPYTKKNRNKYWYDMVNEYGGFDVTILKTGMSWEEACELEIKMIAFYGRIKPYKKNPNYGCLINMTDGGEGSKGIIFNEETLQKMSEKKIGKKASEETKKKQSLSNIGKKRSEETKKKMSKPKSEEHRKNLTGKNNPNFGNIGEKNATAKKVICIVTNKIYGCIKDAAEDIEVNYTTLMSYLRGNNPNKTSIRYL
jgi:hypothetical protein